MIRATDCDGVLLDFQSQFLCFHNADAGSACTLEDMWTDNYAALFGVSEKDVEDEMALFYHSQYFRDIAPFSGVVDIVERLAKKDDIIVITARPATLQEKTYGALQHYFGKSIKDIIFTSNHYAPGFSGYTNLTKAQACAKVNAVSFIEDNVKNACDCVAPGRPVYLMNRPWNKDVKVVEGVRRINSLKETA